MFCLELDSFSPRVCKGYNGSLISWKLLVVLFCALSQPHTQTVKQGINIWLSDALKKHRIIWDFFPKGRPPPLHHLLGLSAWYYRFVLVFLAVSIRSPILETIKFPNYHVFWWRPSVEMEWMPFSLFSSTRAALAASRTENPIFTVFFQQQTL